MSKFKDGEIVVIWWTGEARSPPHIWQIHRENTAQMYSGTSGRWMTNSSSGELPHISSIYHSRNFTVSHSGWSALSLEASLEQVWLNSQDRALLLELI